jgi:hypothetical protein
MNANDLCENCQHPLSEHKVRTVSECSVCGGCGDNCGGFCSPPPETVAVRREDLRIHFDNGHAKNHTCPVCDKFVCPESCWLGNALKEQPK